MQFTFSRNRGKNVNANVESHANSSPWYNRIYTARSKGDNPSPRCARERHRRVSNDGAVHIARRAANTRPFLSRCPPSPPHHCGAAPRDTDASSLLPLFSHCPKSVDGARRFPESSSKRLKKKKMIGNRLTRNSSVNSYS